MLKMFSRVLRVQWYTFFDPPTTVAYKNLILTKYTNIEKCGGEKRKTISVCPRALHCQTKFWLNLKQRKFLSHKWSLLETLVLETERKLILIFWLISLLKLRENLRSLRKRIHCKKIRSICFWWNKKLQERVSFSPHFFKIDHKKNGISK